MLSSLHLDLFAFESFTVKNLFLAVDLHLKYINKEYNE